MSTSLAMPAWRVGRATRSSTIGMTVGAVLLAVLVALPWLADRATLRLGVEMLAYLTLAQMWNLLAGYAGLVSIGQQAFVGFGGYALFTLCVFAGLHPLLALPLAGVLTGMVAIPTALVVFRLRAAYFAIGTWVMAEVYRLAFAQLSVLGGGSGMSLPAPLVRAIAANATVRDSIIYECALVIAVAALGVVFAILRGRYGLALAAIRDNEGAAESLGVDNGTIKLVVYLAVAAVTGLAGGLLFLQKLRISPDAAFSVNDWTAFVIFMTVIGGIGRMEGPILGVVVFFVLRWLFADFGAWYLMLLGGVAVVVMLAAPRGLWGLLAERYDLQLFPVQRRLRVLSNPEVSNA